MAVPATTARPAGPRRRPQQGVGESARPSLTVVEQPKLRRGPAIPIGLSTALVALTAALVIFCNLGTSQMSFELTRLQVKERALAGRQQQLQERVDQLGTPQELDRRARALGMVPAADPAYIDLATGRIIGEGSAAPAGPGPVAIAPPVPIPHSTVAPYHGLGAEPR